jgi:hypothetical protein
MEKEQQMCFAKMFPYYGGNIKQLSHQFYSNFDVENGKITNPELDNQLKECGI